MSHALSVTEHDAISNRPARTLRASLGALALLAAAISPAQTLLGATERADPGQAISVTGSGFDGSTRLTLQRYGSTGVLGASTSLSISAQTDFGLMAQLPSGLAFGVYRLQATGASGMGSSVLINAPRVQWVDTPQAMLGQSVRLVGRNLRPSAPQATVRLVDANTGDSLAATVTAASDYDLAFTMPNNAVAGHTYRILVNSNLAGAASESAAPDTIVAVAKAGDPYALGTSWAGDFVPLAAKVYNIKTDPRLYAHAVGDGVANDARALQLAVSYVSMTGGGVVYLPAGNYRVDDGTMVQMGTKVVLQGDGAGKTVLQVGYRFNAATPPPSNYYAMAFLSGTNSGITGLTFRNLNASATPNGILRGAVGADATNRCFLKNVDFEINNSLPVILAHVRQGIVQNCRFTSTAIGGMPLNFSGSRYLKFSNNIVDYRVGRVGLTLGSHNVIEGNTIALNNAYRVPGSVETGGMEFSYGQQILVKGNLVTGYGPAPTKGAIDGEMIVAQASNVPDFSDAGRVNSADGTQLVPTSRHWPTSWLSPYHDDLDRSFVAIVRGKGVGQWRRVASHNASSLTVDKPWTVSPDATSTYAVSTFPALQQTWVGNSIANGDTGLQIYNGGIDCTIANNTLKDTGGITLRASSEPAPTAEGTYRQGIAWNDVIRDNTVISTTGRTPACVSVSGVVTQPIADRDAIGSLMLGADARGNSTFGAFYSSNAALSRYDGFEMVASRELPGPVDPLTNWGTILWNDSVTNSRLNLRNAGVVAASVDPALATTTATSQ